MAGGAPQSAVATAVADRSQLAGAAKATGPATVATTQVSQANQAAVQAQIGVRTAAQNGGGGQGDTRGQGGAGQDSAARDQTQTAAGDQPGGINGVPEPGFMSALRNAPQTSMASGLVRQNVNLQELVETVKATFTTASQSGLSSARISLSPASLGSIEISLTQTSQGLVAHIAADHPDAVETLQQNAADLRRSLEASGTSLLQLDISASGEQRSGYENDPSARQSGGGAGNQALTGIDTLGDNDEDATASAMTIALTGGSLVDVLA
jgi:flagellar hook-length control protein FliK